MNYCRDIRRCPGSHYVECEAYIRGVNCWEIADKPCCKRRSLDRCDDCWVYVAFMARPQQTTAPEPQDA